MTGLTNYVKEKSDIIGISASGLCAIHCLLTPILFLSKPLIYTSTQLNHSHSPAMWASMDFVFLAISFVAVLLTARHTSSRRIAIGLWAAYFFLASGIMLECLGLSLGTYVMYAGSAGLIFLHTYNHRYCSSDTCAADTK